MIYRRKLAWWELQRDPAWAWYTNGVERINQDSKQSSPTCLKLAMEYVCKKDKCLALSYIAGEKRFSLSYCESLEKSRRSSAAKRRIQRSLLVDPDHQAQFGLQTSPAISAVPPLRNNLNILKPPKNDNTISTRQTQMQVYHRSWLKKEENLQCRVLWNWSKGWS